MKKRLQSFVLCLCIVLTLLPTTAIAEEYSKNSRGTSAICICKTECVKAKVNAECSMCGVEYAVLILCTGVEPEEPPAVEGAVTVVQVILHQCGISDDRDIQAVKDKEEKR